MSKKTDQLRKIYKNLVQSDDSIRLCTCESSKGGISQKLTLKTNTSGVFFGIHKKSSRYIGMAQNEAGHIMVVGSTGSGKSSGIAMPTLQSWRGALCVTDVKGELSAHYEELLLSGKVTRPYIRFDPMQSDTSSYDPFWWVSRDGESNRIHNMREISHTIIPAIPNDSQPYWIDMERSMLTAALLHFFKLGLSFSETVCLITSMPLTELCKNLKNGNDEEVNAILGEMNEQKPEVIASVDRGLRDKLLPFSTDPYLCHAFRGKRERARTFSWDDLQDYNIFLCIPASRIEQWGSAVSLMYTQLFRYLERRPEMYSQSGADNIQTLLLMDEFPRFGKLEMILPALATLRSKNVSLCLMVQSVAQPDIIYGKEVRRAIFDNCPFQVILRANDAETQKYLADLIGTRPYVQCGVSQNLDKDEKVTGHSRQISSTRDWFIYPHELSTLNGVILLTPYGRCLVRKYLPNEQMNFSFPDTEKRRDAYTSSILLSSIRSNEGAKMLNLEERTANAKRRVTEAEHRSKVEQRAMREKLEKQNDRRNYVLGGLLCKYFPELMELEPGNKEENAVRFAPFENFLSALAADPELIDNLKERARRMGSE